MSPIEAPEIQTASPPDAAPRQTYLDLVSGKETGLGAGLSRLVLFGLSIPYRVGVMVRNGLYDAGLLKAHRTDAKVISVGNLTTGGTGKTPMVEWIGKWILERNYRLTILSRGYGQRPADLPESEEMSLPVGVNDEGLLLQANLERVQLFFGADRMASARAAIDYLPEEPECFLLDDAFQHRRMHRDLDLLLIDALNPFGHDHLLPRGLLREPIRNMRRAGMIVLTRIDQAEEAVVEELKSRINEISPESPILTCAHRLKGVLQCSDLSPIGSGWIRDKKCFAFCALGNPEGFRRVLDELVTDIAGFHAYPDHYWYTPADLEFLKSEAARLGADIIMTTQKDAVKFAEEPEFDLPFLCLRVGIDFIEGEDILTSRLLELFPEERPRHNVMNQDELNRNISFEGRPEEPQRPWEEKWWEDDCK